MTVIQFTQAAKVREIRLECDGGGAHLTFPADTPQQAQQMASSLLQAIESGEMHLYFKDVEIITQAGL